MKEQLITFETAKLAKEKGFTELVSFYYYKEDLIEPYIENGSSTDVEFRVDIGDFYENHNVSYLRERASAPTQSLLQAWLRSKEIFLYIIIEDYGTFRYEFFNENFGYLPEPEDHIYFETYEEALEKGLQEALKIIEL